MGDLKMSTGFCLKMLSKWVDRPTGMGDPSRILSRLSENVSCLKSENVRQ